MHRLTEQWIPGTRRFSNLDKRMIMSNFTVHFEKCFNPQGNGLSLTKRPVKGIVVYPIVKDLSETLAIREPLWNYTVVGLY